MEYFIIENGQQAGPFTLDLLNEKKITSETLVWNQSLTDWTPAWKIEELRPILDGTYVPSEEYQATHTQQTTQMPPIPQSLQQNAQPAQEQPKKGNKLWLVIGGIIAFFLLIMAFTNPDRDQHMNAIKTELNEAITKTTSDNNDDLFSKSIGAFTRMITGNLINVVLNDMLDYHNYIIFSKSTVEFNDEEHTVAFGFLGKVYTANCDDILKALQNEKTKVDSNDADDDNSEVDAQSDNDDKTDVDEDGSEKKLEDKVEKVAGQVSDKVSKKVTEKLDKKIDEVTDSSTINKIIDKILDLF